MKTYIIDVRYYIPAEDIDELEEILDEAGISSSEYAGGYELIDIEDEE